MITHWENHWDDLRNNETYYPDTLFKSGMNRSKIVENTSTLFIKLNMASRKPEQAWDGKVFDFKPEKDKVRFKVKIEREVRCPPRYYNYKEGWYVEEARAREGIPERSDLYPQFFSNVATTNDWSEFEKYAYQLLKLLGIHEIHKYEKQKGMADGFFKFRNLVVMYDSTLETDFEKSKEVQINNYCAQLKNGKIQYQNMIIDVVQCQKQVWIITRGNPRVIKKVNEVKVKEVPIHEIINIYRERIEENLSEDKFESRLDNVSE